MIGAVWVTGRKGTCGWDGKAMRTCTVSGAVVPGTGCNSLRTPCPAWRISSCRTRPCIGCRRTTACWAGDRCPTTTATTTRPRRRLTSSGGGRLSGGAGGERLARRPRTRPLSPSTWPPALVRVRSPSHCISTSAQNKTKNINIIDKCEQTTPFMLRHLKYHIIENYRYKRGVAAVCQPSILYNIWIKIEGTIYEDWHYFNGRGRVSGELAPHPTGLVP